MANSQTINKTEIYDFVALYYAVDGKPISDLPFDFFLSSNEDTIYKIQSRQLSADTMILPLRISNLPNEDQANSSYYLHQPHSINNFILLHNYKYESGATYLSYWTNYDDSLTLIKVFPDMFNAGLGNSYFPGKYISDQNKNFFFVIESAGGDAGHNWGRIDFCSFSQNKNFNRLLTREYYSNGDIPREERLIFEYFDAQTLFLSFNAFFVKQVTEEDTANNRELYLLERKLVESKFEIIDQRKLFLESQKGTDNP